ncbi:MAG TPA: ABC transporter permease [Bacillota bacterium]|nr:ABC transporter permease [Bacillota bacterium]
MKGNRYHRIPGLIYDYLSKLLFPLITIICALLLGAVIIRWMGADPWNAYRHLLMGSFGSLPKFGETLVYVSPLILTGLSIAMAYRCGLFNIGAEGQYIMGMIGAAWAGSIQGLPLLVHLPLTMGAGILAGVFWGAVPGYFKAKFGAHEVITTIMMNYISLQFTGYLVNYLLLAPPGNAPVTRTIEKTAQLTRFLATSRVNTGILIALLCLIGFYFFLWKTKWGFEIRAVGLNPDASKYAGINVTGKVILTMAISGGLAGLAGALQIQGIQHRFNDLFGFPGYGFDGIAVALLGNNHPAGILGAALLFGAMNSGALEMQSVAGIPKDLIGIIQAIIIFFVAADYVLKKLRRRIGRKQNYCPPTTSARDLENPATLDKEVG